MKNLTRSLLTFVLIYGTKDKARFKKYALSVLEPYELEEDQKSELIDFAYDFFSEMGANLQQVNIISRGVHSGVSDLESKLEQILEKLEAMRNATGATGSSTEVT